MSEAPEGMIPVKEFAKLKGIDSAKIINMIRDGFYVGRKVGEDWFIDSDETTKDELTPYGFVKTKKSSNESPNHMIVTDIKMPFGSMVVFMVKWVIASIPALIILTIILSVVSVIFGGVIAGLIGSR
jgi:hypothetical protein